MLNKDIKTIESFRRALIRAGLLDSNGTIITLCIGDDDYFFKKWGDMARRFIYKGRRVHVAMRIKRMNYGKVLCWPDVTIRNY